MSIDRYNLTKQKLFASLNNFLRTQMCSDTKMFENCCSGEHIYLICSYRHIKLCLSLIKEPLTYSFTRHIHSPNILELLLCVRLSGMVLSCWDTIMKTEYIILSLWSTTDLSWQIQNSIRAAVSHTKNFIFVNIIIKVIIRALIWWKNIITK